MLRMSGRFDDALEQYRIALKIDPTFYISQKELGETYAVMGQEERARAEYDKAIQEAPGNGVKAEYMQKSAMTWLRDQKYDEADKAYRQAAESAHAMGQWVWEARAYRIMAMYQTDHDIAAKELDQAEAVLAANKEAVAKADMDEERARIMRVRLEHAVARKDYVDGAEAAGRSAKRWPTPAPSASRELTAGLQALCCWPRRNIMMPPRSLSRTS